MTGTQAFDFFLNARGPGVNSPEYVKGVESREIMLLLEDRGVVKVDSLDVFDQQIDDCGVLSEDVSDEEAIFDDAVIVLHEVLHNLHELLLDLGVQLAFAVLFWACVLRMDDQLVADS